MLSLSDHQVEDSLRRRREGLAALWNDDQIYDCAPKAAQLVLLYAGLENRLFNRIEPAGKSFFFWDRLDSALLHLYVLEDTKLIKHHIEIASDGTLKFSDHIYKTPQDLLRSLTLKTNVVHHRIVIPLSAPIATVLQCRFDLHCSLYCPPEYPPLLVHIAIANSDLLTAAAIFEHPFINDPAVKPVDNYRLNHLLKTAMSNSIMENQLQFLEFLIQKYSIADSKEYLLKPAIEQAIGSKSLYALELLFANTASHALQIAFETAFFAVVKTGEKPQFLWLLDKMTPEISLSEFSTPSFLKALLTGLGSDCFQLFVKKLSIEIPWELLLIELVNTPINPTSYLPFYASRNRREQNPTEALACTERQCIESNFPLEALPLGAKGKMLLQFINYGKDSEMSWNEFLNEFFPKAEQAEILSSALLEDMNDEMNAAILLDAGALPSYEHFVKLLRVYNSGNRRLEHFKLFLEAVPDLQHAKKCLSIASAFGEQAVKMVFERFPELKTQMDFILALATDVWKGAQAATDQVLFDMMGMRGVKEETLMDSSTLIREAANFTLDENFLVLPLSQELSVDLLVEVLLPRKQVDKIASALKQKPECTYEFWQGCIFSGYLFFESPQWENLIAETFLSLDEIKLQDLIGQAFYYSHNQLASLWVKQYLSMQLDQSAVFKWLEAALQAGNLEALTIFVEYNLHLLLNEQRETFLQIAVSHNAIEWVSALLENDSMADQSTQDTLSPYALAVQNQFLTICRLLKGDTCFAEIAAELIFQPYEEIEDWLFKAFLNSSKKDVEHLLDQLLMLAAAQNPPRSEELSSLSKNLEQFIQNCGPLIVRFPSPQAQKEMYLCYGQAYPSYALQQHIWGDECGKYYEQLIDEYEHSDHSLLELLLKFSKLLARSKEYNFWRMGSQHSLMTYFHGRYFSFWHLAQKIFKELMKNPSKYADELICINEGYQVIYRLDAETTVHLSGLYVRNPIVRGVFKARMEHSATDVVQLMLPHLEQLFNEIQNYSFPAEGAFPEELKRKIALLFWLGCHLVFTTRGCSQYMLMLHRLLFDLHGFQTPPWSLKYPQPDCVAIVLPFSIFYEEYYDALFDV